MNPPEVIATLGPAVEQRLRDAVLRGAEWLSVSELGRRLDPYSENPQDVPKQWLRSGRVFSIELDEVRLLPVYLFDAKWQPLPVAAEIPPSIQICHSCHIGSTGD